MGPMPSGGALTRAAVSSRTDDLPHAEALLALVAVLVSGCAQGGLGAQGQSDAGPRPPSGEWLQSVPSAPLEERSPGDRLLFFCVGDTNGKKGLIDAQGRLVAKPEFAWARSSTEGLAMVEAPRKPGENGKVGFVDGTGRIVIEPAWDQASPFSEGLALVATGVVYKGGPPNLAYQEGGQRGYIGRTGELVIAPSFDDGCPFSGGVAWVKQGALWGLIDRTGKFLVEPRFPDKPRSGFSEGLCPVWLQGVFDTDKSVGGVGYLDASGTVAIPPRFHAAGAFSEGLAAVVVNERLGFIDRSGAFVIEPRFETDRVSLNTRLPQFSSGLAPVRVGGRYGYIDKLGRFAIEPQFESGARWSGGLETFDPSLNFSDGLAAVVMDGKTGYIDVHGCMVIPPQFRRVDPFEDGIARVEFAFGEWGYVQRDGTLIWPPPAGRWR